MPAAGQARRLGRLPCSKELLPTDWPESGRRGPTVTVEHLLGAYSAAGIDEALVVISPEKTDIVRFLAGGPTAGPRLAYVVAEASRSVPETIAHALPFIAGRHFVLGFPDVLFAPTTAFAELIARCEASDADGALGLFPTADGRTTDMVALDAAGRVSALEVRPANSSLRFNWLLAAWGPRLAAALPGWLADQDQAGPEVQLGHFFAHAIASGLVLAGVRFPAGRWLDLGSPAALRDLRSWRDGGPAETLDLPSQDR